VYGRSAFAAKQERLKQAKAEAERDIAAYRAQRETGFQQALANQGTDSTSAAAQLDAETDAEVAEVRREAASRAPAVARMLADVVTGA
jgi:V-type H+-transporting ATPase subunit G